MSEHIILKTKCHLVWYYQYSERKLMGGRCFFKLYRILLFELTSIQCLYHNIICIVQSEAECRGFF